MLSVGRIGRCQPTRRRRTCRENRHDSPRFPSLTMKRISAGESKQCTKWPKRQDTSCPQAKASPAQETARRAREPYTCRSRGGGGGANEHPPPTSSRRLSLPHSLRPGASVRSSIFIDGGSSPARRGYTRAIRGSPRPSFHEPESGDTLPYEALGAIIVEVIGPRGEG